MNAFLRDRLRDLRKKCPTLVPVQVRRRRLKDCYGITNALWVDGNLAGFSIQLDNRMCWDLTDYVLLHEWAHCLAWHNELHPTLKDHGPEFGLAYARVYQQIIEP